jgi:hypothetical protein
MIPLSDVETVRLSELTVASLSDCASSWLTLSLIELPSERFQVRPRLIPIVFDDELALLLLATYVPSMLTEFPSLTVLPKLSLALLLPAIV